MITYNDYLEDVGIISESEFNNIIKSLPTVDNVSFDDDSLDEEGIVRNIIDKILFKFNYVYVDGIDLEEKSFCLNDVDDLEELEEIRKIFESTEWKISNYDDIKEELEEEEKEEEETKKLKEKENIVRFIVNKAELEDIIKFAEKYGYKK